MLSDLLKGLKQRLSKTVRSLLKGLKQRLSKTARISKWEVTKSAGEIDRRTLIIAVVSIAMIGGLVYVLPSQSTELDSGLYRVGVSETNQYYEPVKQDPTLVPKEPDSNELGKGLDILVGENQILLTTENGLPTQKSMAAVAELRSAVKRYNRDLMSNESNQSAAFPVTVTVNYLDQNQSLAVGGGGGVNDRTNDDGAGDDRTGDDNGGGGGPGPNVGGSEGGGQAGLGGLGGGVLGGDEGKPQTPSGISPPFPFGSLILAFAFIVPMNFVVQAYASSMINERIKRRGELLLVSPVKRFDIIAGKTLPYLGIMMLIAAVTAYLIGGGLISIASVFPIALIFLATTFIGAMFSRSFKELTFVTVSVSVLLTSYVFIPAIFTDVHPIAVISPITMVVKELNGSEVTLVEYGFSTLPLYLTSLILFGLGAGVYREEDMFTQRSIPLKTLDAIASRIKRKSSITKLSILFIPFVFAGELLVVATLYALPITVTLPLLLVSISVIEEIAKSIHIYAGHAHSMFDKSLRTSLILGFLSGLGFFIAEKLSVVIRLVQLPELEIGQAAFGAEGSGATGDPLVIAGLFLAPLILHVVTASISSIGASKDKQSYVTALMLAVVIHTSYNMYIIAEVIDVV